MNLKNKKYTWIVSYSMCQILKRNYINYSTLMCQIFQHNMISHWAPHEILLTHKRCQLHITWFSLLDYKGRLWEVWLFIWIDQTYKCRVKPCVGWGHYQHGGAISVMPSSKRVTPCNNAAQNGRSHSRKFRRSIHGTEKPVQEQNNPLP